MPPKRPRRRPLPRLRHESKLINSRGAGRPWRRVVAQVCRDEPMCYLQLPGICTGRSETADHVRPRKTHPHLTDVRWNLRGACKACNMTKGDMSLPELAEWMKRKGPAAKRARALGWFG